MEYFFTNITYTQLHAKRQIHFIHLKLNGTNIMYNNKVHGKLNYLQTNMLYNLPHTYLCVWAFKPCGLIKIY